MMNRKLKTKIPSVIKPPQDEVHQEAREADRKTREHRKVERDKKKRAKVTEIKPGDKVLIAQKKSTTKPPFNPNPFEVVSVEGHQIRAQRGDTV